MKESNKLVVVVKLVMVWIGSWSVAVVSGDEV